MRAAVDERFGVVHGLVNAAAETDRGSVWDTTAALIDRLMAVNVRAPMLLLQAAARIMKREGVAGSIVNIGSVASYGSEVFLFPYATSKSALHAMTRNAAFALARDRIRVNLLNPGWMDTPAEDAIQRRYHGAGDDWLARAEAEQPFGRLLKPDEVARGICFLLSDESGMMTGACLDFDQTVIGAGKGPIPTSEGRLAVTSPIWAGIVPTGVLGGISARCRQDPAQIVGATVTLTDAHTGT